MAHEHIDIARCQNYNKYIVFSDFNNEYSQWNYYSISLYSKPNISSYEINFIARVKFSHICLCYRRLNGQSQIKTQKKSHIEGKTVISLFNIKLLKHRTRVTSIFPIVFSSYKNIKLIASLIYTL